MWLYARKRRNTKLKTTIKSKFDLWKGEVLGAVTSVEL